ncbi:MAG: c-type cytochrome [Balneolaceae bacterium]|nr:c-type cytochrome [Balneolaceae bacterium]
MKVVKWTGIIIGSLLLLLVVIISVLFFISKQHENQIYNIDITPINIDYNDESILEKGRHVATIRACVECHGANLGGRTFIEDPVVGLLMATNLTSGPGGIGNEYSDEDYIRAIRHGVRKDGKSVIFMPSHEYNVIDSDDLAALMAYIRSKDPVDSTHLPETKIGFPFRLMYVLSDIHLFPARLINHSIGIPEPVAERTPRELGAYVATTCIGCHGDNYGGGKIPGVPPHWPDASNITLGGVLADYSETDFFNAMRNGITIDGREMEQEFMPWQVFGYMTDEELSGLFEYLQSLPVRATGTR